MSNNPYRDMLANASASLDETTALALRSIDEAHHRKSSNFAIEIIKREVENFYLTLNEDEDIVFKLTNFGQIMTISVTNIISESPNLIVFKGFYQNDEVTLIQHVTQLNFLLWKAHKEPESPRRRIGFELAE